MMNGGDHKQQHPYTAEEIDRFLQGYNPTELRIASEFLSNWLPFLSKGLCTNCSQSISDRVRSLHPMDNDVEQLNEEDEQQFSSPDHRDLNGCSGSQENYDSNSLGGGRDGADINDNEDTNSLGSWKDGANGGSEHVEEDTVSERVQSPTTVKSSWARKSWADMAQEDELEAEEDTVVSRQPSKGSVQLGKSGAKPKVTSKPELSREQRERIRFTNVKRKKDFICLERVNGKIVNILDGLELHAGVFSAVEQKKIVDFVYELEEKGKKGELKERTYSAPAKWMRGKGRVTIQFGCCYNYATDRNGNPPGILQNELVDPIPQLFKVIIKRLVKWHVLPPTCVPDSCIVNIYDQGDCIPPHIDNHDFLRPFCTVSFLSECNIVFGTSLKVDGPGEFSGATAIPLPVGSVLVLNGNGADVAKHCVPAVPTKRISITFRKMDASKWPVGFVPEPDLQGLQPLLYETDKHQEANFSKSRSSNRQGLGRDDATDNSKGLLGSQPRFYSQPRQQGPPGGRRRVRLEY